MYLCEVRRVDEGRWAAMQGVPDLWTRARTHLVARRRPERMETQTEPVVVNEVVGGGGDGGSGDPASSSRGKGATSGLEVEGGAAEHEVGGGGGIGDGGARAAEK